MEFLMEAQLAAVSGQAPSVTADHGGYPAPPATGIQDQ